MHGNPEMHTYRVTLTSTSTLFNKNNDYNRLAGKTGIANLDGPVKRKIKCKEREGRKVF